MGKSSRLYAADGYDGPPLTIAGISAFTKVPKSYVYTLMLAGKPVGGFAWRATGQSIPGHKWGGGRKRNAEEIPADDIPRRPPTCRWSKGAPAPLPAAPAGRTAWVYATDPEAYEVLPINPMRLTAAPDGQGVGL